MNNPPSDDEPMIRFGDEWIPARDAWAKMQTATVAVDRIARFNERFPHLSSVETREVVPLVRRRLKEIELRMPGKDEANALGSIAVDLLSALSPEEVLDTLAERHNAEITIEQLLLMTGKKPYMNRLRREAEELKMNRVSPQQTAQLWNELGRPAPSGGLWSAQKISELLSI